MKKEELDAFEAWWAKEGQYVRAGGGDYEKCFAYAAWQATLERQAQAIAQDRQRYKGLEQVIRENVKLKEKIDELVTIKTVASDNLTPIIK